MRQSSPEGDKTLSPGNYFHIQLNCISNYLALANITTARIVFTDFFE